MKSEHARSWQRTTIRFLCWALLDPWQYVMGCANPPSTPLGCSVQEPNCASPQGGWHLALWPWGEEGGPGCLLGLTPWWISQLRCKDSDAAQLRGNTNRGKDECFLWLDSVVESAYYLCVFECAPAVSMHARACFCGEEGTQGFHQSPKRVFDSRRPKKWFYTIIKRFNCVWIFAFPPGGANLL